MGVKIILTNGKEHDIPDVAEVTDKVVEELAKLNIEDMVANSLVDNRTVISSIVENDCFDSSNEKLQDVVCIIANEFCFSTTSSTSAFGGAVESIINNRESDLISELTDNRTSNKADVYIPNITTLIDKALPATGKTSDYCIIKDTKTNTQTAYMYVEDHWEALNGNYNADNVYFDNDFIITQDIGTFKINGAKSSKVSASGKSLKALLGEMFAEEIGSQKTDPSIKVKSVKPHLAEGMDLEVGTKITEVDYTIEFSHGKYSQGTVADTDSTDYNTSPDCGDAFGEYHLYINNNDEACASGYEDSLSHYATLPEELQFTIDSETKKTYISDIYAAVDYTATERYPATNLGNYDSECEKITLESGTKNLVSTKVNLEVAGYRKYYYGPIYSKIDPTTALTSELIKGLLNKSISNCNNKVTINWKAADYEGMVGYIIAVPSNNTTVINKVSLVSNSNQDITDTYNAYVTAENIRGNGEDAGVLYNVWLYQPNSLGTDEEHSITFKNK